MLSLISHGVGRLEVSPQGEGKTEVLAGGLSAGAVDGSVPASWPWPRFEGVDLLRYPPAVSVSGLVL